MTKPQLAMASSAGLCGVAGIGCGAYFLSENLNSYVDSSILTSKNKTIRSHLQGDGYVILETDKHDNHWATLTQKYKDLKGKLRGADEDNSNIDTAQLKSLCQEALEQEYAEGHTYAQTTKWCVIPTSVTNHLTRKGFKKLTEELLKDPKHQWIVDTYDNGHYQIKGVTSINKDSKTLVTKCDEAGEKQNYDDDFHSHLASVRQWCFIQ
nr:hypothetical protein [Mycoplasma haemofelis]